MKIVIKTQNALELLKQHKQTHMDTFEETVDGWKIALEKYTEELNQWAKDGGVQGDRPQEPYKPKDYTKDYDNLIDLLENHVLDNLEVEEYEYDQIIKDKFGWTDGFLLSNSTYASK